MSIFGNSRWSALSVLSALVTLGAACAPAETGDAAHAAAAERARGAFASADMAFKSGDAGEADPDAAPTTDPKEPDPGTDPTLPGLPEGPRDAGDGAEGDAGADAEVEPPVSPYPSGPYGGRSGTTLADHTFTLPDGSALSFADIRGDREVKAILWVQSTEWCGACRDQIPHLNRLARDEGPNGLYVMESVFQDYYYGPADAATAARWSRHGTAFTVVADTSPSVRAAVTPSAYVIDAETMMISRVFEGDQRAIDRAVTAALAASER